MRHKTKAKKQRKAKLPMKHQQRKQQSLDGSLAEYLQGKLCVHCQQPITSPADAYYCVKAKVWRAAGMERWDSGYLHVTCLEQRIGRKLEKDDYYGRYLRSDGQGADLCDVDQDYAVFIQTGNADRLDDPEWWRATPMATFHETFAMENCMSTLSH
jgi:hypothetical protein